MAKKSNLPIIIGAVAVGAVVVGVIAMFTGKSSAKAIKPGSPVPKDMPGYRVEPNCGGITITNEEAAMEYARTKGAEAPVYGAGDYSDTWTKSFNEALGLSQETGCALADNPAALAALYRLSRAYTQGAADVGKLAGDVAETFLGVLRLFLEEEGAAVDDMPEGLGVEAPVEPVVPPAAPVDPTPLPPPPPTPPAPLPVIPKDPNLPTILPGYEPGMLILKTANESHPPILAKVYASQAPYLPAPMVVFIGPIGTMSYETVGVTTYRDRIFGEQDKGAPPFDPTALLPFQIPWAGILTLHDFRRNFYMSTGEAEMLAGLTMNDDARYVFLRSGRPFMEEVDAEDIGDWHASAGKYVNHLTAYQELVNIDVPFLNVDLLGAQRLLDPKKPIRFRVGKDIVGAVDTVTRYPNQIVADATAEVETALAQLRAVYPTTKMYLVGFSLAGAIVYEVARHTVENPQSASRIDGAIVVAGRQGDYRDWPAGPRPTIYAVAGMKDPVLTYAEAKRAFDLAKTPGSILTDPFARHSIADLKPTLNLALGQLVK